MGIPGLLPFVKKASKNSHIKHFSGCTVAVDAYGWLYKGAFGCAVKIGQGEPTDVYVKYCMKYVNVLLSYGLKPILVLDGRNLPAKEHTDAKRRENRKANKAKAKEALRRGDKKTAWEHFTKCLEITPAMARELIKVLRQEKIDYIIAPYEADAQLAYLAKSGIADLVLTEDSDLVVFGCPRIFFKMSLNGDGVFFEHSKLSKCMDVPAEQFQFERFRQMCILSGCDYLPSLPGIGLGRAKKVFTMATNPDIARVLKQIPLILKLDLKVPQEYIDKFIEAEQTFLHQLVFDPRSRTLQPLNPYPATIEPAQLEFAGKYEDLQLMADICLGNVDLKTLERVPDFGFDPCHPKSGYPSTSIWSKDFIITKRADPVVGMKLNTKHSSTVGKKTSVSLAIGINSTSGKRSSRLAVKVEEAETQEHMSNPLKDDEILSFYHNANRATNNGDIKGEPEGPPAALFKEHSTRTKRRCLTSLYKIEGSVSDEINEPRSETSENDDDRNADDESPIPKRARKNEEDILNNSNGRALRPRIANPFLKTPEATPKIPRVLSKVTSLIANGAKSEIQKTCDPVCLVKKNTIYDLDAPNVIVKSQYFRITETVAATVTANKTSFGTYRTRNAVKSAL